MSLLERFGGAETLSAIDALHRQGLRVAMVTGDNSGTAQAIARSLGIDEVHAEVLHGQRKPGRSGGCSSRGAWRSWATASTTLPLWPRPTWCWWRAA